MDKPAGLWVAFGGEPLAESVERSIEQHDHFTTTVTTREVKPRHAELAVVSLQGSRADYLGISQVGRRVATGQITIVLSNLVPLDGMSCATINTKLPRRFRNSFEPPEAGVYRPTPRLWEELLHVIGEERPNAKQRLADLRQIIAHSQQFRGRVEGGLEVFERDAVASALQIWGGPSMRKRILRGAVPDKSAPVAPFLSQLKDVLIREDVQLGHDHLTFPGMEIARNDVIGSVVLRDSDGGGHLTILNCNRQPLEETLGVDLIYYNHRFDSFVLVQYKRMVSGDNGVPQYRPKSDASHDKELERMIDAQRVLRGIRNTTQIDTNTFRLSDQPFYIKLCEAKAKAALNAGLVSGMYIPLDLWRRLLKSPDTQGPRGGVVMSWASCRRRLSNTDFTNLLRNGWIGSAARQSNYLGKIIEQVLGSCRMLVLAATSTDTSSPDYRRDSYGRFAAEDDPGGAT